MTQLTQKNWQSTRTGTISAILITILLTAYITKDLSFSIPLALSGIGGIVLAASIKIADYQKFTSVVKPLSGILTLISGTLVLGATALFTFQAFQTSITQLGSTSGLMQFIFNRITSLSGYSIAISSVFFTGIGIGLIYWDRVDEEKKVGTRKQDVLFNSILGIMALVTAFGTALISKVPIQTITGTIGDVLTTTSEFSGIISGTLIILAYVFGGKAWRTLPIKESIPRTQIETYEKLGKLEKIIKYIIIPALALATAIQPFINNKTLNYFQILTVKGVRELLIGLIIVSIVIVLVFKLVKMLASDKKTFSKFLPYTVFGLIAYLVVELFLPSSLLLSYVPEMGRSYARKAVNSIGSTPIVLGAAAVAMAATTSIKTGVKTLKGTGFIPKGLEGTFLTSTGLFLTTIGLFTYQPKPLVLFLGVAGSLTVWEIGKRSTILGKEIGRKGSSTRSETVQTVSKILLGIISVITARAFLYLLEDDVISIPGTDLTNAIIVITAIGLLLIVSSLKEKI